MNGIKREKENGVVPICCKSLQVRLRFASNTNAAMPAANGADAEVPVCDTVHE